MSGELPHLPDAEPGRAALIAEQIAIDYEKLFATLPQGDREAHLALARLTQNASVLNEEADTARNAAADIHRQAFTSPVSELPNRNALLRKADAANIAAEMRRRAVGEGRNLTPRQYTMPVGWATIFIDFDHFKEVNDTFGHEQGDRLLRLGGHAITLSVREQDEVYHLSGDEFVSFSPRTVFQEPEEVSKIMHAAFIGNKQRQIEGDPLVLPPNMTLTDTDIRSLRVVDATFGVHWFNGPYVDRLGMLNIAEGAMRELKKGSRDR
jgi:diguanylate cyclase (GGDEF)-like protein